MVELREHAQALAGNLLTGFPGPGLRSAIDLVLEADGLVVVTPVFNASYSGLFKMFFDVVEQGSLSGTPVLMAATGGTARHSLALEHAVRPLFAYLHAVTVPTAVFAATDDWGSRGDAHGGLVERIDRASGELARLVAAAPPAARTERVDPFETPTLVRGPARRPLSARAGPSGPRVPLRLRGPEGLIFRLPRPISAVWAGIGSRPGQGFATKRRQVPETG